MMPFGIRFMEYGWAAVFDDGEAIPLTLDAEVYSKAGVPEDAIPAVRRVYTLLNEASFRFADDSGREWPQGDAVLREANQVAARLLKEVPGIACVLEAINAIMLVGVCTNVESVDSAGSS